MNTDRAMGGVSCSAAQEPTEAKGKPRHAQPPTARHIRSDHPVIIATGEKSLDQLDFELPGPIALEWGRRYRSGYSPNEGWFGQGWTHPLAAELFIEADVLRYRDEQGREVALPAIEVGQEHFQTYEQFTLTRPAPSHWALRHNRGLTHHFRQRHAQQTRLPLEVIQDRNLRRVVLQFDEQDFGERFDPQAFPPRPRAVVDSAGRKLSMVWTEHGQLAEVLVEASEGRIEMARYRYGSPAADGSPDRPDLLSHTDANGHTRSYTWEQHLLVGYTLASGQRFSNRYDRLAPTGRVVESLGLDDGTGERFEYQGRSTRVRDMLGRETVYIHNARQDIVAVHDAEGNVLRNEYDDAGRPAGNSDGLGRFSSTTYEARGNLVEAVDAAGNATTIKYDALNLPLKVTDALGSEWFNRYDARGNLIARTDPLGHTTLYELDALGQVVAIIDAQDKRTTLQWDEAGNLTAHTDCSGNTFRNTYDPLGHLLSTVDALGQETRYVPDAQGQVRQVTLPDGAQHRYEWDGQGNLIRYVDPLGHTTRWKYTGFDAPLERVDALGHVVRYEYNRAGRLVTLTNENGEKTRLVYDALNRMTDEIGIGGRHQRFVYNAAGELTHLVERGGSAFGAGKVTCFGRDAVGRMTSKRHVGEEAEFAASSRFAYDALGRLTLAENAWSLVQRRYDALGQLLGEVQALAPALGAQRFEFTHEYDALGIRTQTALPDGRKLNFLFYGCGHLHQVNLDGQIVSDFERDALYREVRRSQGPLQSEFEYDPVGRLAAQRVVPDGPGRGAGGPRPASKGPLLPTSPDANAIDGLPVPASGVIERQYRYDAAGQLVQWLDKQRGSSRYGYDATGRVVRSQIGIPRGWGGLQAPAVTTNVGSGWPAAVNEEFRWDPASNPLPVSATGLGGDSTVSHLRGNRLEVWQDARYRYDEHGNLRERLQGKRGSARQTRTLLTWDAAHQLARAEIDQGPYGVATHQSFVYRYDALGRRIGKSDVSGHTRFAWDEDRMALEQRGVDEISYLYHPDTFLPLAQIHHGVLHHLHTDHLGTPLEASNDSGQISWRATYRTWGNVVVEEAPEAIPQRLRFLGQYFDSETGLHYSRFRHYDPDTMRFVSEDPIGLIGDINLYAYAPNPIMWVDPFGLAFAHVRFPKSKIIAKETIKMQGSRDADFKEANRLAGLHGCRGKPTIDAHNQQPGQTEELTWHHATYNKKTNTAVMELVTRADHEAKIPHSGSVSDYEKAHGVKYETDAGKAKAKALNKKCPCK